MKTSEFKKALISNYEKKLNKNSKWYKQDLKDFKINLDLQSDKRIKEMYDNMIYFNSKSFEKSVKREEKKLLKGGMYDINNIKPENSLD